MSSLNKAMLIGNLGKDPEVRTMQTGDRIVSFSMATSESWKDKASGERKERTHWHNVVIFNDGLGQVAEQYLRKGSKAYVEGQVQTRKWTDKDGADRYTTEIVMPRYGGALVLLSDGPRSSEDRDAPRANGKPARTYADVKGGGAHVDLDDEVPFLPEFR